MQTCTHTQYADMHTHTQYADMHTHTVCRHAHTQYADMHTHTVCRHAHTQYAHIHTHTQYADMHTHTQYADMHTHTQYADMHTYTVCSVHCIWPTVLMLLKCCSNQFECRSTIYRNSIKRDSHCIFNTHYHASSREMGSN